MLTATVHGAPDVVNTTSLWIWAAVGVITLIGGGYALYKAIRRQGAADAERKDRDQGIDRRLKAIEKNLSPNGLNTNGVGDVVGRVELALTETNSKLDQYIGANENAHRAMRAAIRRKQDKEKAK